jgi:Asp-tRNA(Asn)/Glu-tRNA(Gln) amidotransferase A subunit family amidase
MMLQEASSPGGKVMAQTNTIARTVRDLGIVCEAIIGYDSQAPMLGRAGPYVPAPVGMFGQIRLARQDDRTHPQRQIDQR